MILLTEPNSAILEILQKSDKNIRWFEECFAKLQIEDDEAKLLESKLNRLNLEDDDKSKLIPRAPWPKNTQANKFKPYPAAEQENVNINQYVSYNHSCGGIYVNNLNNHQVPVTHVNFHNDNTICTHLKNCDTCILQWANSPDFDSFLEQLLHSINKTPVETPRVTTEPNIPAVTKTSIEQPSTSITNFYKPQARRLSVDSGFQSDNPSPLSDSVMSPTPPNTTENKKPPLRRILPKISTKEQATGNPKNESSSVSQKTETRKQSAQEQLRSTLNPDIKQVKWVEVTLKRDNEIFEKDDDGQTILQKLLRSDEKYITESFYAIVERLKKNPTKCEHIIKAEKSICKLIQEKHHPDLLQDYFSESLQIIRDKTISTQSAK